MVKDMLTHLESSFIVMSYGKKVTQPSLILESFLCHHEIIGWAQLVIWIEKAFVLD